MKKIDLTDDHVWAKALLEGKPFLETLEDCHCEEHRKEIATFISTISEISQLLRTPDMGGKNHGKAVDKLREMQKKIIIRQANEKL